MGKAYHENDQMIRVLYEASHIGNVSTLNSLMQQDPLILYRINSKTSITETPLHISCMLGHVDFTKALLSHKPQLALEFNSFGSTALHVASAEGHVDIVKELVVAYDEACMVLDQEGRIPLHYAVIRGRKEVVRELIRVKPECVGVLHKGKTILHLCVTYNRLEILKDLVMELMKLQSSDDGELLVNFTDFNAWNSVLHLAISLNQVETIRYLLSIPKVREAAAANLENSNDMNLSAGDHHHNMLSLDHNPSLETLLAVMLKNNNNSIQQTDDHQKREEETMNNVEEPLRPTNKKNGWRKIIMSMRNGLKHKGDWLEEARGTLSLVATMIATITFQAAINPPGGIIQQNIFSSNTKDTSQSSDYNYRPLGCFDDQNNNEMVCPGQAVSAFQSAENSYYFLPYLTFNTISFVSSLAITLLLVSGVPLKNKAVMWVLSIGMCITLTFLALTYLYGVFMITPFSFWYNSSSPLKLQHVAFYTWIGLLGIVALFIVMRFKFWLGNFCMKKIKRQMSMRPRGNNISEEYRGVKV